MDRIASKVGRLCFRQSCYRRPKSSIAFFTTTTTRLPPRTIHFLRASSLPFSTTAAAAAAATGTAAVVVTMAATYTTAVSKPVTASDTPEDARSLTHHIKDKNGNHVKFQNPHPSAGDPKWTPYEMLRKIFWAQFSGNLKAPQTKNAKIPSKTPEFLPPHDASSPTLRATWLGHACYFVEFPSGLRVLFDPVFEDRCAPVQFAGPKRYTPPPCSLSDLPAVDAVVISHSHYDHLSHSSVQQIAREHPSAHFFVGLGLEKWFRSSGIERVTEMDWWQDVDLTLTKSSSSATGTTTDSTPNEITARISCLPCQHSSGRTGLDPDQTLWASWSVSSGSKSVWFGGDTGYRKVPQPSPVSSSPDYYSTEFDSLPRCPQFKQIGERRGPFDLGLIPIGAYHPRWLFSWMHADPYDAVEIFKDTKCKRAMAIHWGTWVLTGEEVQEPPELLKKALTRSGIKEEGVFDTCAVGETREF